MQLDGATVVVTGANGFVGSRVCRRLAADRARVRAMVRRPGASGADDHVTEVVGDPTEEADAERAVTGADAVVHCAATVGDDLDAVRRVNVDGTGVMARAALAAGAARFVHISTAAVYDRDRRGDVVDEDTPLTRAGEPYALTKAEAEVELATVADDGLAATVLRPPAILGWAPTSTWGQKLPQAVAAGKLPFTPHPEATFAWVHVDDLADAVAVALTDDRAVGRTYNLVGGHATWRDYVDALRAIVAPEGPDPLAGAGEQGWTGRFDASRLGDELGVVPARSFADGIGETAEHWAG
jgi:nucleoside-diphosphate-sugar epimerase